MRDEQEARSKALGAGSGAGCQRRGILLVVSGPSGSGKTTLCRRLAEEDAGAWYSVSCTTRPPRLGEEEGVHYLFLNREDFRERIGKNEFLEYAEVHQRDCYGTLKQPVLERLRRGVDVVMDLDVQGAAQLRSSEDEEIRAAMVDIFILPPGIEELIARVRQRGPMAQEEENRRMSNAREEMAHWGEYAYSLVSREKDDDFARFRAIVEAERLRSARWMCGE